MRKHHTRNTEGRMRQLNMRVLLPGLRLTGVAGLLLVLALLFPEASVAQSKAPASAAQSPQATAQEPPQTITASDIPARADQVQSLTSEMAAALDKDNTAKDIQARLPGIAGEIDRLVPETEALLSELPDARAFLEFRARWMRLLGQIRKVRQSANDYTGTLAKDLGAIQTELGLWQYTLAGGAANRLPPLLLKRVDAAVGMLASTERQVSQRHDEAFLLASRLADMQSRAEQQLAVIDEFQQKTLLEFDSPALWNVLREGRLGVELTVNVREAFVKMLESIARYLESEPRRVVAQIMLFLGLLSALLLLQRYARRWKVSVELSDATARVLNRPLPTALLITLLCTGLLHPDSPRALRSLVVLVQLVPLFGLLRGLYTLRIRHALYVLGGYYLFDRFAELVSYRSLAGRLTLILLDVLIVLGLAFEVRLIRRQGLTSGRWKVVTFLAGLLAATAAVSLIVNVMGGVGLSDLMSTGVLRSLYLAFILQAVVLVFRGVIAALMNTAALRRVHMVARNGPLVQSKLDRGLIWLAAAGWATGTLAGFSLLEAVVSRARQILTKALEFGHLSISLGDILGFLLTIWLAIVMSRFVRFLLNEEVYPRVSLARGVSAAISRLIHYTIVAVGFLFALSAAGLGLDRVTVLAGAFGVGIGFGLQDIVKNFVAGLVLLFERPIKVGDNVQVGELSGEVRNIGLRSSTVRTWEGADVILPNGNLTANELINWTLADLQRRIDIAVGVAYGTDPHKVLDLLAKVGLEHPDLLRAPAPAALFVGFGDSSLDFSLRVWTDRLDRFLLIKSELTTAIHDALRQAGIEIPFPQRDLHIRSVDPGIKKIIEA